MVSYLQAFEKDIGFMTDIDELKGKPSSKNTNQICR